MAKGFKHGAGGANLNFKVVGNPQPASPRENTIWVNTDQKITGWIFCATEPTEPTEGMVWISTGTSSDVDFNALKQNNITVYPASAKQYVSGTWVTMDASLYQNSTWTKFSRAIYYIFMSGEGAVVPCATIPASADTISVTDTKITFSGDDFAFYTKSKINTQGYTTLRLTGIFPSIDKDTYQGATGLTGFGLSTSVPIADNFGGQPGMVSSKSILTASTKLTSHDCPISGSGSYYVIFAGARSSGEITEICLL